MNTLKAMSLIAVVLPLVMINSSSFAQSPATRGRTCDHPDACAKKQPPCRGPCIDEWDQNGTCLGGYCPQGIVPTSVKKLDLHLYGVTPAQQQKIKELLDKDE